MSKVTAAMSGEEQIYPIQKPESIPKSPNSQTLQTKFPILPKSSNLCLLQSSHFCLKVAPPLVSSHRQIEALSSCRFLAKRGTLVVFNAGGESLSVTELFQKLSEPRNGCTLKYFMAYRHLKLLRYVVGRHDVPWTMKSCNRSDSKCVAEVNNDEVHQEEEDSTSITPRLKDLRINEIKPDFVVYLPNSKFRKSSPGKPSFMLCMLGETPPNHSEFEMFESNLHEIPLKYCYVGCSSRAIFFSSNKVELLTLPDLLQCLVEVLTLPD